MYFSGPHMALKIIHLSYRHTIIKQCILNRGKRPVTGTHNTYFLFRTDVLCLINTSMCEPVQPMEVEDEEIKNQSRLICSESFIHQSDQILRRLVGEQMQQAKGTHTSVLYNNFSFSLYQTGLMKCKK